MTAFIKLAIVVLSLVDTWIKRYAPVSYEKAQSRIDEKLKQIEREHEDGK